MKKIGVLGGGQLARMLALAGYPLGINIIGYEPVPNTCAGQVTQVVHADFTDQTALTKFAQAVECVTIETENIPLDCAQFVTKNTALMPTLDALRITQDRLLEKELLQSLKIPTAQFCKINSWEDLQKGLEQFQFPGILKTRRNGYDGKGQAVLRDVESAKQAWEQFKAHDLILESFVPFNFEVSIISVRSRQGETKFYPLVANEHREGILRVSKAPYLDVALQKQAEDYAQRLMDEFNYVGVLTIEFFVLNGKLIANEIAPRVHNSGHWTIEGAITSQFENHLRAICGYPLGSTDAIGFSVMYNLIGTEPAPEKILAIPGAHYHTYGKEARKGRKLGHITLNGLDATQVEKLLALLLSVVE